MDQSKYVTLISSLVPKFREWIEEKHLSVKEMNKQWSEEIRKLEKENEKTNNMPRL